MARKVVKRDVVKVEEKPVKGFVEKPVSVLEEKREFKVGDCFVVDSSLKVGLDNVRENNILASIAHKQAMLLFKMNNDLFEHIILEKYPELKEFNYTLNHNTLELQILSRKY